MGVYSIQLVGESHYQPACVRQQVGGAIRLIHEPENHYDNRAVKAVDHCGDTIGYVPRDCWVSRLIIDEGKVVAAKVRHVLGGGHGKPMVGIVIEVDTMGSFAG